MGRKKTATGLGKSIIRDRFGKKNRTVGDSFLHTSELKDGYDWNRLNLQSVTEQNNLDDFLTTAEMAGKEFTAEKQNLKFVSQDTGTLPKAEEIKAIHGLHTKHASLLRIPRRPYWNTEMTASEVDQNERLAFLDWRRSLVQLEDDERIVMTPYEKNLDFWRQLWRVIERSDVVVQIVDARNPLLFFCGDLETYVREVDSSKTCLLLINKADYLTQTQREVWCDYFTKKGVQIAFWSAVAEANRQEGENIANDDADDGCDDSDVEEENNLHDETNDNIVADSDNRHISNTHTDENIAGDKNQKNESKSNESISATETTEHLDNHNLDDTDETDECKCDKDSDDKLADGLEKVGISEQASKGKGNKVQNSMHVYTGPELLVLFKGLHTNKSEDQSLTTVGMVGYPNVGKSSTINAILKMKKVPVSATPGRTKHFQTLYVESNLMLCDCPGLVFPSFVTTKADLVVNGILPIDQMRDCLSPTAVLCERIPRWLLEATYGILIQKPDEGEDPNRNPTAYELLNAYAGMRGYMTSRGQPDGPRSSRYLLKDFVNGKLLYCHPPPEVDAVQFNDFESRQPAKQHIHSAKNTSTQLDPSAPVPSRIDAEFFTTSHQTIHQKSGAVTGKAMDMSASQSSLNTKPWKKHNNKKKKEKLRRVYAHLDKQ